MTLKKDPNVYKNNSYEFEFDVFLPRGTDGVLIPAVGLTDLSVFISAVDEPPVTIHADLEVTAAERSGKPGTYFGLVSGDDITTHMFTAPADYDNKYVWIVGSNASHDIQVVEKVKAFRVRKVVQ